MKCILCGFESETPFRFCPKCGVDQSTPTPPQESTHPDTATGPILAVLRNTLFLIICILVSTSCIMTLSTGSVPLTNILLAVFLSLTYAQAYKGNADADQLRCVSGTVYANYVICYVAAGLVALMGLIFAAALTMIADSPALLDKALSGIQLDAATEAMVANLFVSIPGAAVMVIFLISAALIVVFNLFSTRYIHRFAKSVHMSLRKKRLELECVNAAKIWLFIFGGFSALSAITALSGNDLTSGLGSGCNAAAAILAGILAGKLDANPSAS